MITLEYERVNVYGGVVKRECALALSDETINDKGDRRVEKNDIAGR